jgi:hypothetical protein
MNILWSPEAIEDLNSLHSIEQLLPGQSADGRAGRILAHVSSSSPRRLSSSPIDCSEMSFKFCASIMGRGAGLKAFNGRAARRAGPFKSVGDVEEKFEGFFSCKAR